MSWLTDPLAYDFMRQALAASVLAAIVCSLTGSWIVVRGLSFIGDALAHGVIPGVAIALLLGASAALGAVVSALVMAVGLSLVSRRSRVGDDTAIGLLFVGMLALGVLVLSSSTQGNVSVDAVLFGSVLGVDAADVWFLAAAAVITLVAVVAFHRPLTALAFHPRKATTLGMRPRAAHVLLLVLVTLAVVSSFQAVGTLMVFGLLVGPPATAALLTRRMAALMAVAVVVGAIDATAGLLISYHRDTAAGATIAVVAVVVFFVALLGREVVDAVGSRRHHRPVVPA